MEKLVLGIVGFALFVHFAFAFFVTIEARDYPLIEGRRKVGLLLVVWLIPILGVIWAHKAMGLGWAKGTGGAGDVTTGGSSGSDGGCGGGDGGC